jgi:hypothetical protein
MQCRVSEVEVLDVHFARRSSSSRSSSMRVAPVHTRRARSRRT